MTPRYLKQSSNPRVPAADHPFCHYMPVQLRINDIDFLGHLNNIVYLSLFDLGKARYFEDMMNSPVTFATVGLVIVNINIDFFAVTFFDEPVEVWTTITSIGERSVKLEQRLINAETHEVKSICRTVMAGFDPKTSQGAPLSPAWIVAAEKYENRQLH